MPPHAAAEAVAGSLMTCACTQACQQSRFPGYTWVTFRLLAGFASVGGVVNAVGQDYIGVLVLGIFNAAIGREFIPPHLQSRIVVRSAAISTLPLLQQNITAAETSSPPLTSRKGIPQK